jgi:acetyl esterase/lipase
MKLLIVALCALGACGHARSPAPPRPVEIAIWPGTPPDARPAAGPEQTATQDNLIAGRPWREVTNVARPTMTIYPPRGANTGAAVVVFPGGGYKALAIDLEGTEVCDWLTSAGITCVLLKYRVPDSGPHWDKACQCYVTPPAPIALQDAQRTMGLLRARATELQIDPHKLGVLGFSAGGHLVAAISTHFAQRAYPAVDAADAQSCRPDFGVALYPGHLWTDDEDAFDLAPDIATAITPQTSPTFLLQAEDDPVDDVNHSLVYYVALKKAGVPVEMHLYAHGGHAFGLRRTALPITRWPTLVEAWLATIGVLSEPT